MNVCVVIYDGEVFGVYTNIDVATTETVKWIMDSTEGQTTLTVEKGAFNSIVITAGGKKFYLNTYPIIA